MSKCSNVDIYALGDEQLTGFAGTDCCNVFDEVGVDSEFEIEASTEDLDGGSCLDSDTKGSFEGC